MDQETTTLLRQAKAGSNDAMNHLFEHVAARLLTIIRLRLGPALRKRVESREILRASVMKAFDQFGHYKEEDKEPLMAWLAGIAENEIRNMREDHGRQSRDMAENVVLSSSISETLQSQVRFQVSQVILSDELKRLEKALENVEPDYREIILLRKLEELSFNEIGRRLGKSADACRMLLARAMTAVVLKLKELP